MVDHADWGASTLRTKDDDFHKTTKSKIPAKGLEVLRFGLITFANNENALTGTSRVDRT